MNFEKLSYFATWGLIVANFFSPTKANYNFSFSLSGRDAGELIGLYLEIQFTHDYIATQDSFAFRDTDIYNKSDNIRSKFKT